MGELSLNNLTATLGSPARAFLWTVQLEINGIDQSIRYRARSTSTPGESIQPIDIPYMQTPGARYPGKRVVSKQMQIQFLEGEDGLVSKSLQAARQIDPETGGSKGDTARGKVAIRLLSTRAGSPWMGFEFIDAFLGGIGEAQLSQDSNAPLIIPATIFYNDWRRLSQ